MFTDDLLNQLQAAYGLTSDYQLAKKLGLTTQAVSSYRCGRSFFSDAVAIKIADLLELEPLLVLACANADRHKTNPDRSVFDFWADLAERCMDGRVKMSRLSLAS